MNRDHDLEINAYLDGELSEEQRREVETLLTQHPELRQRHDDLRKVKALVAESFATEAVKAEHKSLYGHRWFLGGLAASLLLAMGFILGALSQGGDESRFVLLGDGDRTDQPAIVGSDETRIVFHLTNPDQVVAGELLEEVEDLLEQFRDQKKLLRIEIVSHGDGLGLLRERLSQHQDRISALAMNYDNLAFVACQNTIDRLRVEKGLEVTLVPEAEVIDSGVSHVVKRQMEGWSYIRV